MTVNTLINQLGLYATDFNKEEPTYRGDRPIYVSFEDDIKSKFELGDALIATEDSITLIMKRD